MAVTRSSVLRIVPSAGSAFEFDVQGVLFNTINVVRNEAGSVTEINHQWRVESALIRTADGTAASTFDRWLAFVALVEARSGDNLISSVRIIRDPDSANVTEVDLAVGYEQLRITEVESGGESALAQSATWNAVIPVSMVITARKRNSDANGIVDVTQTISNTWTNGLHKLVYETILVTEEGTDAVAKAKAFAAIDIAEWGTSYAFQTNGEDGIAWDELDSDTITDGGPRVPTHVRAVSAIQKYAVDVGTTGPGTSPDSVLYAVTDRITRDETQRTITASAQGPGALAWVLSKRPPGQVTEEQIEDEQSGNVARGTWVRIVTAANADPVVGADMLSVEVSGGDPEKVWQINSAGLPPVEFVGGLTPYKATVKLRVVARGYQLTKNDMRLPGPPPGWSLDRNASSETEPTILERGTDVDSDRWVREANLVFMRADKPPVSPLEAIRAAQTVASYWL